MTENLWIISLAFVAGMVLCGFDLVWALRHDQQQDGEDSRQVSDWCEVWDVESSEPRLPH